MADGSEAESDIDCETQTETTEAAAGIDGPSDPEVEDVEELSDTPPKAKSRKLAPIQKNKTPGRDSLQLDGTLSSLMLVKTHIDDVINWKPDDRLLDAAKKSTRAYNAAHRS